MRKATVTVEEVIDFFKEHSVVTWDQLTSQFGITPQAIRKKIKGHTYLNSLNHNHKSLILKQCIGKTDQYGLWSYNGIIFSIHGNTTKTVINLINNCEAGLSTKEIGQITTVKCWGILLKLLKQGNITRIKEGFDYIYLSSMPEIRQAQLKKRGLASQEPLIEAQTPPPLKKEEEIHSFLELGDDDYLLKRLEIVRRVKSGKKKVQVATELGITPDTVRNTYETFKKYGAKGLVITRKKKPYKMTESTEKEILIMKAKQPDWSPETIAKNLRERGIDIGDRTVRAYLEKVGLIDEKKTL